MIIKVTKLWHNHISLRSYQVDKAIRKHEAIIVKHNGQQMTIPITKLQSGTVNSPPIQSKINIQTYRLVDYEWKPDNIYDKPNRHASTELIRQYAKKYL